MLKKIKKGLVISVIISLSLHFISMTVDQFDWHLAIQWKALKESIKRIKNHNQNDSIGIKENHNNTQNTPDEHKQNKTITDAIKDELSKIKQGYAKNSKLRFSPESKDWQEIDELLNSNKSNGKKENGGLAKNIEFLDNTPPKPIKISMISASSANENKMNIQLAKKIKDCGEGAIVYGGVGLVFQPSPLKVNTFIITQVAPDYPADKAGIKNGDEFYGDPFSILRGEIGSSVTVSFMRNGKKITTTMIREKICYRP